MRVSEKFKLLSNDGSWLSWLNEQRIDVSTVQVPEEYPCYGILQEDGINYLSKSDLNKLLVLAGTDDEALKGGEKEPAGAVLPKDLADEIYGLLKTASSGPVVRAPIGVSATFSYYPVNLGQERLDKLHENFGEWMDKNGWHEEETND